MIDLHMHTTYSDGTDTVKELLEKAEFLGLEVISITDHNTCKAYFEMEKFNVKEIYHGNIIVGCEFTANYDNRLIEVLGYNFDYRKVSKYLQKKYNFLHNKKKFKYFYKEVNNKIKRYGLECDLNVIKQAKRGKIFEIAVYEELRKYEKNRKIIDENIWDSYSDYYRKGITNSKSKMFINKAKFYPSVKEIVDLIHESGGVAFLAHPYQYKFNDTEEFLEKIYKENSLDGVECFYTTFNEEQTNYLISFARDNNLLISGGSDYHGLNKKDHNLGIGRGNLNISKDIIKN